MLIDHVIAGLSPSAGGPTRTVLQLTDALAERDDARVRLITQSAMAQAVSGSRSPLVERHVGEGHSRLQLALGLPGRTALFGALKSKTPNLLHCNGIWHPLNHWCARTAHQKCIPLVLQPRGMLEPRALGHRALKKRLALALYQRTDLECAALVVATAEQEAEHLRQFGLRQPIAVIPNGVDLHAARTSGEASTRQNDGLRRALFLGRVHPVKGLLHFLEAWAALDAQGWLLQIAGPDEGGHLAEVLAKARQLGIAEGVQYLGALDDEAKWSAYQDADLFVLPSFTENFGVVVAEALAAGLPVITTTGTPWRDLQIHDCGWWVSPTVAGLQEALTDALTSPLQRLREMGERGRAYVQRYDWSHIAGDMLAAYRWVLGRGPQPDCVRTD